MRKNNFMFIFHDLGVGGVQRKIADVVHKLSEDPENEISVVLEIEKNYDHHEDLFLAEVVRSGAEVYYYRSKNDIDFSFFRIPISLYIIWKILRLKPTNVIAFMEPYAVPAVIGKRLALILQGRKVKTVIGFDNVATQLLELEYANNWRHSYWKFLIQRTFPMADTIVVPSEESRRDMVNNFGLKRSKIKVNRNWVISPKASKGKQKQIYDILYVGRVDRVKNLRLFVDLIADLKKPHPKIKGCIVGWGDEMQDILKYALAHGLTGNIDFVGSVSDVGSYYRISKVFLLTSDFEGLPIVGLEAMAYGLPVVTKDYPGADEMVVNGVTGYICSDKKSFVEKLNLLLRSPKKVKVMGIKGRKKVLKEHGLKSLQEYINYIIEN